MFTAAKDRVVKAGIRLATAEALDEMENDLDDDILTDYLPAATVHNDLNHKAPVADAIDEYMYYIIPRKQLFDCG